LGFLLAEVNGTLDRLAAMQPTLGSAGPANTLGADGDRNFEFAIQTLMTGLDAQLAHAGPFPDGQIENR
jgi:hypothetical protein